MNLRGYLHAPLVVVLAAVLGAGHAAAVPSPSATPASPPAEARWLTLVTGDRVNVVPAGDGRWSVEVEPAARSGEAPSFKTIEYGEGLYVIPSDASPLLDDRLDRELFNVTKLARNGYTTGVPVIVTGAVPEGARTAVASLPVTRHLPSVEGYAATVADGAWWRSVGTAVKDGGRVATADPLPAGQKVWLDDKATVTLEESVPMVGAPQAWAAGYDGTGTTVAVLDTGIDTGHPDLAGKVAQSRSFVAGEDAADQHGHGTHVAGTVAGTGTASGGRFKGVAPGATLLNGKICDRDGACPNSAIIAGMEWAAPLADVVSMSIGSDSPSDGTDPMSQAVNALTAQHDTSFVIAAGNNGQAGAGSVGTPGAADAALTVGSVDKTGQIAASSGRGPRAGDFAIKPDITAPGVDIVAPRAGGTTIGGPVDDNYTALSGTSMATPHVAGAAAIVRQQDPELSAADVKAALVTTAAPSGSLTVYGQGGGLTNVPAALTTPVIATPSPVNLGYFPHTGDDTDPVSADVTYANRGTRAVTLDLSLNVRDGDAVPPAAMLAVSPPTLTIAPGGTATATVTLDVDEGEVGQYGGYLRATGDGVAVHTPVGFHKEPPVHELTVTGIARDGQPAQDNSSIDVIDAHDTRDFLDTEREFVDGTVTVRVPSGTYHLAGIIESSFGHSWVQDRTMVTRQVEVTGDTEVVLDARKARPVRIDTPAHRGAVPVGSLKFGYRLAAEQYGHTRSTYVTTPWNPMYVLESDRVTAGEFDFYTQTRLAESPVTLAVTGREPRNLHPRAMFGSPAVTESRRLRLVSVGSGEEADYTGVDATGAVVLAKINPLGGGAYYERIARAHDAAALLVVNDNAENVTMSMGTTAQIPGLTLSGDEGAVLRGMLSRGPVTVRLGGTAASPYIYDVVFPESGRLPARPSYVADPRRLATLVNAYHGAPGRPMGDNRFAWLPYETYSLAPWHSMPGPQVRTEYVTPGDIVYRQSVAALAPNKATLRGPVATYRAGERRKDTWFASPLRPGIIEADGVQAAVPSVRTADTLDLRITEWSDTDPGHTDGLYSATDTSAFRLYQDGKLIAEGASARDPGVYQVSPDPATYRMELQVARRADWWPTSTATRTVWTLPSRRPAEGVTEVLPLLHVDYDAHLDLTNTAPSSPRPTMDMTVRHQQGAKGGRIGQAKVSVSYDGQQWRPAAVVPRGGGKFTALLPSTRSLPPGERFVSLRVTVADSAGNRIEQEITNAWRLPGRR